MLNTTTTDAFKHELHHFVNTHPEWIENLKQEKISSLITAFTTLHDRIQDQLHDSNRTLSDALLALISPFYLSHIPSLMVAQAQVNTHPLTDPIFLPAHTHFDCYNRQQQKYIFSSCYPLKISPIHLSDCTFTQHTLSLTFNTTHAFSEIYKMGCHHIGLYLDKQQPHADLLYTLLHAPARLQIQLETKEGSFPLPNTSLQWTHAQKPLLPYPENLNSALMSFIDYVIFPEKFYFFDLTLPENLLSQLDCDHITFHFYFHDNVDHLTHPVDTDYFKLHCVPLMNLFEKTAVPFLWDHRQASYPINLEIYPEEAPCDIEQVTDLHLTTETEHISIPALYSHPHPETSPWRYTLTRQKVDDKKSVFISLSTHLQDTPLPKSALIHTHVLCTQQDAGSLTQQNPLYCTPSLKKIPFLENLLAITPPTPRKSWINQDADNWHYLAISQFKFDFLTRSPTDITDTFKTLLHWHTHPYPTLHFALMKHIQSCSCHLQFQRTPPYPDRLSRVLQFTLTVNHALHETVFIPLLGQALTAFFKISVPLNCLTHLIMVNTLNETLYNS